MNPLEKSILGWHVSDGYSPYALAPCKQWVVPLQLLRLQHWCAVCGEFHDDSTFTPIAYRVVRRRWKSDIIESKELCLAINDAKYRIRKATQ